MVAPKGPSPPKMQRFASWCHIGKPWRPWEPAGQNKHDCREAERGILGGPGATLGSQDKANTTHFFGPAGPFFVLHIFHFVLFRCFYILAFFHFVMSFFVYFC